MARATTKKKAPASQGTARASGASRGRAAAAPVRPRAVAKTRKKPGFKLTYATMFDPPEELHSRYEKALAAVKAGLGRDHGMMIGGQDVHAADKFEDRSPINTDWLLGVFQKGGAEHARQAIAAARAAFPAWARHALAGARAPDAQGRGDASTSASTRSARCCRSRWARTAWRRWATRRKPPT